MSESFGGAQYRRAGGGVRRIVIFSLFLLATANAALAQPTILRLGYGAAAEEPLWLVVAQPDLAQNYSQGYTPHPIRFTRPAPRPPVHRLGQALAGVRGGRDRSRLEQRQRRDLRRRRRREGQDHRVDLAREHARLQHRLLRQG